MASASNTVEYWFTATMTGDVIARLPLTGVTYSRALNAAGQLSATLPVEDPRVAQLNWIQATVPLKCAVWVIINGSLEWGGMLTTRRYNSKSQKVTLGAVDWVGYLSQRLQAKDYSTTWTAPADPMVIASTVIGDALATANSAPLTVATQGSTPSEYWVTMSFPRSQRQSVAQIISMFAGMGFQIGFDYASDVYWDGNLPAAQITLSYPRRGRIAGQTGLTVTATTGTTFEWDEDGTSTANQLTEMSTGSGGVASTGTWEPALSQDGYPLLEAVISHSTMSSTPANQAVLDATVEGDLSVYAYQVLSATVEFPAFSGSPKLGDWIVGDDLQLVVPQVAGPGVTANPRFPAGLTEYLRVVRDDVTIDDQGLSTVKVTLALPPSTVPQRPPA